MRHFEMEALGYVPTEVTLPPLTPTKINLGPRTVDLYHPTKAEEMMGASIFTDTDLPYWAFFWPACTGLARLVAAESGLSGMRVLELGAGSGLVGMGAAIAGAQVTQADYDATAVLLAAHNAQANGLVTDVKQLDWKQPSGWPHGFDMALGSEVLYEKDSVAALVELLKGPVLRPGGIVAFVDPGRPFSPFFVSELSASGYILQRSEFNSATPEGDKTLTLITGSRGNPHESYGAVLQSLRYEYCILRTLSATFALDPYVR